MDKRAKKIRDLNDSFRRNGVGGRIIATRAIAELPESEFNQIFAIVKTYDDFERVGNPYGENDFGAFDHNGERILWKIDYYDKSMEYGSEDPSDPAVTMRVLTILYAHEY